MKKIAGVAVTLAVAALALTGCDTRECAEWKTTMQWVWAPALVNGKSTLVYQYQPVTSCARYKEEIK